MNLKDKYPDEYFQHWLVMLSTIDAEFTKEGFENQIGHYINFEGEEEMRMLQSEVEDIVKSGDLLKFKEIGKQFDIMEVNESTLKRMSTVKINWKK